MIKLTKGKLREILNVKQITYADGTTLDVIALLDEAKKEFKSIDEEDVGGYVIDWFEKWFGSEE